MKIVRMMALVSFVLIAANSIAASQITSVSGVFSSKQTITVTGSGFGATGPVVRFFDDFENGTVGNVIGLNKAVIGSYSPLSSTSRVKYTDLYSVSGSKAFISDQTVANTNKIIVEIPNDDYVFVSWWQLIPAGDPIPSCDNADGCNWKMVWFVRGDTDAQPGMSDMVQYATLNSAGDSVASSSNSGRDFGWISADSPNNFQAGRWTRIWSYVKSSTTTTGAYDAWYLQKGLTPQHPKNLTNVQTLATGALGPYNRFDFPGYTRITAARPIYDDIYIASGAGARARVEIGDKPIYTQCTSLHVLPVTAWSDTSIKATVNTGSLMAGQAAYLFVVDANGNISAGQQIVIGAQSQTISAPLNLKKTN